MTCLREGQLQEYLSERDAGATRARAEAHLVSCTTCRSSLDRLAATNAYVDGLLSSLGAEDWIVDTDAALARLRRRIAEPSRGALAQRSWTVSAAACVLLVVLFGLWHWTRSGRNGAPPARTVDVLPHGTGAPVGPSLATAPARHAGGPQAETSQGQAPPRLPSPGNGLKIPVSLHQAQPEYTAEALKAHVEGTVMLAGVVLSDGTVGNVRVTQSLDKARGLDAEAIRCARQWTFQPARDDHAGGRAVAMPVGLAVEFKINGQTAGPAGPRPFEDAFAQGAYSPDDPGIVGPQVVNHTAARYTVDALRAKIQGDVVVEAIVMPDGTVGKLRVVESIDPNGLDDEAMKAVKQWSYLPATLHGQPVSVLMTLTVPFRVH